MDGSLGGDLHSGDASMAGMAGRFVGSV